MTEIPIDEYRTRARTWLADHVPVGWRSDASGATPGELIELQRSWLRTLRSGGYAAPGWPTAWGGGGASLAEQVVLEEELARAGAPELPVYFVGLNQVGATLIAHADGEQQRHISAILDGEIWCQGFSEPGAGSDLAGLSCSAVRDGDHYVLNGQKVWSSHAEHAQFCLLLARTDASVAKHKGISVFLLDMSLPGVEVRPIRQLNGDSEFSEIFLTDVRVPVGSRLGDEGAGWSIAQTALSTERGTVLLPLAARLRDQFDALADLADELGLADEPAVLEALGRLGADIQVLQWLCAQLLDRLLSDTAEAADASVLKVFFSELLQRVTAFGVELQGLDALDERAPVDVDFNATGIWMLDHLTSWRWTIAAGSNEIQRNLIGERGLGLAREPAVVR